MQNLNEYVQRQICQICKKELSSKQNLKQHLNTHTGEKPFKCKFIGCKSEYMHASQLSCHKLLHKQHEPDSSETFDDLKHFALQLIKFFGQMQPNHLMYKVEKPNQEKVEIPKITFDKFISKLPLHSALKTYEEL